MILLEFLYRSRILICSDWFATYVLWLSIAIVVNMSCLRSWSCLKERVLCSIVFLTFSPMRTFVPRTHFFWEYDYPSICITQGYLSIIFCCVLVPNINCCSLVVYIYIYDPYLINVSCWHSLVESWVIGFGIALLSISYSLPLSLLRWIESCSYYCSFIGYPILFVSIIPYISSS